MLGGLLLTLGEDTKLTHLGASGFPRARYGSFTGKTPAATGVRPVAEITRLHTTGTPGQRYGDFSGKTPASPASEIITRLGVSGIPRQRYGTFAGRPQAEVEADYGGSTWLKSQKHRDKILREDQELLDLVATIVTSGILR